MLPDREEAMVYYFDVNCDRSPSIDARGLDLQRFADVLAIARALREEAESTAEIRIRSGYMIVGWLRGEEFIPASERRCMHESSAIH
jgi:hypothetical protein